MHASPKCTNGVPTPTADGDSQTMRHARYGKFVPRIASCWTGSFGPDPVFCAISGSRQQNNACDRQLCSVDYARVNPRQRERQQEAQSCCSDGRLLQVGVATYSFHDMTSKCRNHERRKKRQGSQETVAEELRSSGGIKERKKATGLAKSGFLQVEIGAPNGARLTNYSGRRPNLQGPWCPWASAVGSHLQPQKPHCDMAPQFGEVMGACRG